MDPLPVSPTARARFERLGQEFLAGIFEVELGRRPDNVAALIELGHVYTRLGRFAEGLGIDVQLVEIAPEDPTVRYNLSCSLALTGAIDAALDALEVAVELGFHDTSLLREDEDLAALRGHPRFEALLERVTG